MNFSILYCDTIHVLKHKDVIMDVGNQILNPDGNDKDIFSYYDLINSEDGTPVLQLKLMHSFVEYDYWMYDWSIALQNYSSELFGLIGTEKFWPSKIFSLSKSSSLSV